MTITYRPNYAVLFDTLFKGFQIIEGGEYIGRKEHIGIVLILRVAFRYFLIIQKYSLACSLNDLKNLSMENNVFFINDLF